MSHPHMNYLNVNIFFMVSCHELFWELTVGLCAILINVILIKANKNFC